MKVKKNYYLYPSHEKKNLPLGYIRYIRYNNNKENMIVCTDHFHSLETSSKKPKHILKFTNNEDCLEYMQSNFNDWYIPDNEDLPDDDGIVIP